METMRNFFALSRPVQPTTATSDSDSNSSTTPTPTPTITTVPATAIATATAPSQVTDNPGDILSDSEISALDLGPSVMDSPVTLHRTNSPLPEVKVTPPSASGSGSGSDSSTPVPSSIHERRKSEDVARGDELKERPVAANVSSPSSPSRDGQSGDRKKGRGRGGAVGLVFRTISSPLLSPLRTSMNHGSTSSNSSLVVPAAASGGRPGVNRARTSFRWRKEA